jgi:hypothetical protein
MGSGRPCHGQSVATVGRPSQALPNLVFRFDQNAGSDQLPAHRRQIRGEHRVGGQRQVLAELGIQRLSEPPEDLGSLVGKAVDPVGGAPDRSFGGDKSHHLIAERLVQEIVYCLTPADGVDTDNAQLSRRTPNTRAAVDGPFVVSIPL